jgi:hypothetical protein
VTIASQLLNTTLNPANLGGESVLRARELLAGAEKKAREGGRIEYLNRKAAENPALAMLAAVLNAR